MQIMIKPQLKTNHSLPPSLHIISSYREFQSVLPVLCSRKLFMMVKNQDGGARAGPRHSQLYLMFIDIH